MVMSQHAWEKTQEEKIQFMCMARASRPVAQMSKEDKKLFEEVSL
jgi:hypothetical protein